MDFALEQTLGYLSEEEKRKLLAALEGQVELRACLLNPAKISPQQFLLEHPHAQKHPFVAGAFLYDKKEYDLGKSLLHEVGALYIQDPAAMMPVYFLGVKQGDKVIDLCAAPGGKSIDAALLSGPSGLVVSNDISYPRAKELSGNIERLGLGNVIVTSVPPSKLASLYPGYFDKVILDAPCSGSAMFRKLQRAKEDWTLEKVKACAKLQQDLLEQAYALLRPGGALVYSTCSFSSEENEEVALSFLAAHPDMEARLLPDHPSFYKSAACPAGIHLFPHRFPGEGQFLLVFEKQGEQKPLVHKAKKTDPKLGAYQETLRRYALEGRCAALRGSTLYSLPFYFDADRLSVLRYGLAVTDGEDKSSAPDFALSRYLPVSMSIPLNKEQAEKYLLGESFPLKGEEGFQLVSYRGYNLGFVKLVKGMGKNHFPKGRRRRYLL